MTAEQTDIRGVFAGGTFCYEAQLALQAAGLSCESNAPVTGARALQDKHHGHGHSLVDMGDDEFTQGRPHPMIDPELRNARLLSEAHRRPAIRHRAGLWRQHRAVQRPAAHYRRNSAH